MQVLLIATQSRTRELLSDALRRRGHEVRVVEDAEAAYAAFRSGGCPLMLFDADRPDGQGFQFCHRMREVSEGSPCVIVAAGESLEPEQIEALLAAGADDYLTDLDDTQRLDLRLAVIEGFVIDTTKQRLAEAARQESEKRYDTFLRRSVLGYVEIDMQYQILIVNPCAAEMFGCPAEDVTGRQLAEFFEDAEFSRARDHIERALRDPGTGPRDFKTRTTGEGAKCVGINPLPLWKDGQQVGYQFTMLDTTRRKEAEEALRESEQRFRTLFDSAVDGILVTDLEGKAFSMCNRAICRMLGYSEDEIKKLGVEDIHPVEDLPRVLENFQAQVEGRLALARELPVKRKDGSVFFADVSTFRITLGGRKRLAGVFRDVTQRKEAAEVLRKSEERYRLIAENMTDLVWTAAIGLPGEAGSLPENLAHALVADHMLQQWRFTFISPSVEQFLGYRVEEMMDVRLTDLLPEDSLADAKTALAEELVVEQREPGKQRLRTLLLKHRARDGSIRWGEMKVTFLRDEQMRPVGLLGVTRDVTERKQAEQALRASEGKFRSLIENVPDIIAITDCDGTIQFLNHGLPGMTTQETVGTDCFRFVTPGYRQPARDLIGQAIKTRQIQTAEAQDVFGRWWACAVVPMAEDGEVASIMLIGTDITQQRRATQSLEKERELLRHLLDLHERDRQLTAYEIHDGFSQYVTGALYNLQGFRELQSADPEEAQRSFDAGLSLIHRSIQEARRMIGGLRPPILDESGVVAAIDYLACEVEEGHDAAVEFIHDVRFERLAQPLESAIFRIVQESLTNARRHSQSDKFCIELRQHDGSIQIDVRDWGIGFDPNRIEEGCIGLRGIRERVRLFGGQIAIETAPGKGTHIRVSLPLVEAAANTPGA